MKTYFFGRARLAVDVAAMFLTLVTHPRILKLGGVTAGLPLAVQETTQGYAVNYGGGMKVEVRLTDLGRRDNAWAPSQVTVRVGEMQKTWTEKTINGLLGIVSRRQNIATIALPSEYAEKHCSGWSEKS